MLNGQGVRNHSGFILRIQCVCDYLRPDTLAAGRLCYRMTPNRFSVLPLDLTN